MKFTHVQCACSTLGVPIQDPRAAIEWVSLLRSKAPTIRAIAIDVTTPGLRARDLSRSDRRDLAATLRRRELDLAGLDLFIPQAHFADPAWAPRAIEVIGQTLGLAGELAPLVGGSSRALVSVHLPGDLDGSVAQDLGAGAERAGAILADHHPSAEARSDAFVIGVDPASVLMSGGSPAKRATRAGALRLSDASDDGRCAVGGSGSRLELGAYAASASMSGAPHVVIDVRQLRDPAHAAIQAADAWAGAMMLPE